MSDNSKRIKKVFKYVSQFSKYENKLEKALSKLEWPMEIFFMSLTNEIIMELVKINTSEQTPKTHKRIGSNISNNNIYIEKSGKVYLYQMIQIFDEIKKYKQKLTNDIIEYIITYENIQKILHILMATNRVISSNPNIIKERNEFNSYIMNLLINIINLNNKILIDVLSSQSEYNSLFQLFSLFSKTEENRNLLYELELNIFMYYPDNDNLKELINCVIKYIYENFDKNYCKNIINEIKTILFLYKNEIRIINKIMMDLIVKIFTTFEEEIGNNLFLNDFLKFCFNEICFDGNNKYYSRYKLTNKSKTLIMRNITLSLENTQKKEKVAIDHKDSLNSENSNINNYIRGKTVYFNNISDIENHINSDNIIKENKEKKNDNEIIEKTDKIEINNIEKNKNSIYNADFMNFLLDIYSEFINLKLKNSYNLFFSELFFSINNSNEGKNEYSFLVNNTNYTKIVLPSLIKLKDESLLAVYFSKIISLSVSNENNIEKKENDCYIPEIDLQFLINNMDLFLDENEKIFIVISSQIINLIKMNNNIIDVILNKCNIFEIFLAIINSESYKNEIKERVIEFLDNILNINNNKFKYTFNIPIITYNIDSNALIKKIYLMSFIYENKINELNNKIVLIVDYMDTLYKQNKIQEMIIFFDILLEGIYKNLLKVSTYKIINDETINKINNILYDISIKIKDELSTFYKNYLALIFILLKFQYNSNKKNIIYNLNDIAKDNKNKIIIDENLIYVIIKNIFVNEQDLNLKLYLLNFIFKLCLDTYEIIENINDDTEETNNDRDEDNYILKAPFIVIKLLNILYEIKDYKSIDFLIEKLMYLMKNSFLNIKLIISNNNFIQIIIKILIELYNNKKEENLYNKLNMLLNDISKYFSESVLIQYIKEINIIFYKIISSCNQEKEDENFDVNKKIVLELFNILKDGIINSKKNNYDYLSLSNFCFKNPFIYNLFYIKGIKFDKSINTFLCLDINIRISTFNKIQTFYLANFINKENESIISFSINKDKKIIISENKKESILEFKNINEILKEDRKFHKLSIIINTNEKEIYFEVDKQRLKLSDNKENYTYGLFDLNEFDIIIGYNSDIIKSNLKLNKNLSNLPIIDINNILITKFNNFEEYNLVINSKNKLYSNENLLENININKIYNITNNNSFENFIIADINFQNKNIKIIKSKKIKKILNSLNGYLSNNILSNKYINYLDIYSPSNFHSIQNSSIKVYMLSLINNLEEYYAFNNSNNIVLYNVNKKYIHNKIYNNYNTAFSACNYFFIDFFISFFFDIENRRRSIIIKNNQGQEKTDNTNEIESNQDSMLNDNFLSECILIILEIIFELPKKETIDYFLYKNNIVSIKLKMFFYRNTYFLNENSEFIQKFFKIIADEEKSSILEEEERKDNRIICFIFITEIFLDLFIFQKLKVSIQNQVLIKIMEILFNNNNLGCNDEENKILFKLLMKIYNIILYYGLSSEQINYNLNEENSNSTPIELFIKCLNLILNIFQKNENNEYLDKVKDFNYDIINFNLNYNENFQTYKIKNFIDENISFIENNFISNDLIYNQMQKIISSIAKFQTDEIKENNNEQNNDNIDSENKGYYFYFYLNNYFKIKFENIFDNIKYDKMLDNNYINLFLNFEEYRKILGIKNFSWFLSLNESAHKIQNKFFLKKNDIKQKKDKKKRINGLFFTYEYLYNKELYNSTFKSLYQLFLFDKIINDFYFINSFNNNNYKEIEINSDNSQTIENCLYIKTIHKTLSIIIILKEYIVILTNICVDNNKKLHVVKNDIDEMIWCLHKEEYETELEQFISKNDKDIIKDLKGEESDKNNGKKKGFGYNNSLTFSYKKIYYKNITEMHKVSYLTIPNSIEIFTKKGKSYFICLNITKREKIFMDIISRINERYKNKDTKIEGYSELIQKKSTKNAYADYFYMRNCPLSYIENNSKEYSSGSLLGLKKSSRKKTYSLHISNNKTNVRINYNTALISINTFLSEASELWTKNKISNFDYIMLLNILSGRSLNNLSQYFILPRIFVNFNHNILNWISSSIYRDLSYPIFACDPFLRNDIKNKYDLIEEDKYHSGTFYSTYAFVAYFLIRQRPFSEISLEIQGGEFDATDRLFIGSKEICGIREKCQESIPPLMTLPEMYVNNNKFDFGKTQKSRQTVKDFVLPNWSKDDPRKFSLVIKRIFESRNVNMNLNKWIDLIFGTAQSGPEAVKSLNTFRKACYEISLDEIEELKKSMELPGILIEKQELGYNSKQIFHKPHKKKENLNEYKEYENIFFDTNLKLRKIKFIQIINDSYNSSKKKISFNSINDFLIDIDNDYIKNINIDNNSQGGIASLKSVISAINDNNYNIIQKFNNPLTLIKTLKKVNKFIILGNNYNFLGKNYDYILCHKDKYLEIFNFKLDIYYAYYLNEGSQISSIVCNDKGNKIYVAFSNGNIFEYKIFFEEEPINVKINENCIYPIIKLNSIDKLSFNYKEFYLYNLDEEYEDKSSSFKKSNIKKSNKKQKTPKPISHPPIIILQKNLENSFSFNNPHIPEIIVKIKLNEKNGILIALTETNLIYIISLNNKFKLMHIITYYKDYKFQYKIKNIIPFSYNGDFLIYTSMTVHLFSINGVPLCDLNLLDKVHELIPKITYCNAAFLNDAILFTGHEDSSIIIWKVKNRNTSENFEQRLSYVYNSSKTKSFLNEYYYNYDFDLEDSEYNYNIQECELKRKFEIVSQIKMDDNFYNSGISYMNLSQDMSYMVILDKKKNIYILSNFDDYKEENNSGNNTNMNNSIKFGHSKVKKIYCISCCKEIEDSFYRASRIQSFANDKIDTNDNNAENILYSEKSDIEANNINEINSDKNDKNKDKDTNYICEECKLKLVNTDSYLYNY